MTGHFISRKYWPLASVFLISGSLAGFGLGQQVGHIHQQPKHHVAYYQAASVAGAIGTPSVTTVVAPVPIHHTGKSPTHTPARPPAAPQQPHHKPTPPPAPPPSPPAPQSVVIVQTIGPAQISVTPQTSCQPAQGVAQGHPQGHSQGKDDGRPKAHCRKDSGRKHDGGAARSGEQPGTSAPHAQHGTHGEQSQHGKHDEQGQQGERRHANR